MKLQKGRCLILKLRRLYSSTYNGLGKPLSDAVLVPASSYITALTHRSLVRISGTDRGQLLQGLLTADINDLQGSKALYSMVLNAQGRVLYDVLLYHHSDEDYLMECDTRAVTGVIQHLKRYALRSKVNISSASHDYSLWALYPGSGEVSLKVDGAYPDPRLRIFGTRVLTTATATAADVFPDGSVTTETKLDEYRKYRHETGIAEGTEEIPVGSCFPLEYNLDYLNGVSFSKGCYLGQELTARTHHTGVIRKRVMPVMFVECPIDDIPSGSTIVNRDGKSLGKLITHHYKTGLALLRIKESCHNDLFIGETVNGRQIQVLPLIPSWWPTSEPTRFS